VLLDHGLVLEDELDKVPRQEPPEEVQLTDRRDTLLLAKQDDVDSTPAGEGVKVLLVVSGEVLVVVPAQIARETVRLNRNAEGLCEVRDQPVDYAQRQAVLAVNDVGKFFNAGLFGVEPQ